MTNSSNNVIYTGITNNIIRRVFEHKNDFVEGLTKKYQIKKLVYFEIYNSPESAIIREKQIKAGSRKKKIDLIIQNNAKFDDLYPTIV